MKTHVELALLVALVGAPLVGVPVLSRAHAPPVSPLAGTWTLVAADNLLPDGRRVPAYGTDPRGLLIVDQDGRYSLQIFRADRPHFASGDKRRGSPDEYQAAVLGMSSHIGRCAADPEGRTLTFRIERASYPNWEGKVQKRKFTLSGDELSYQIPASAAAAGVIPISVWRRARAP